MISRRASAAALVVAVLTALLAGCGTGPGTDRARPSPTPADDPVVRIRQPFTGDLDAMRQRRVVRALVSLSRTNFFYRNGRPVGFEADLMRQLERRLNRGVTSPVDRISVVFVPTPFDRLLDDLNAGHGDLVAATLSVTAERKLRVAFSKPYLPNVEEVIVHNHSVAGLSSLDDLAGRRLVVRAGSSYVEHLAALDRRLEDEGGRPIQIVEADPSLAEEDLLELVAGGAFDITVADDYLAHAWAPALTGLVVRDDIVLHRGIQIAWAVRRGNPRLRVALDDFARTVRRGSRLGNLLFARYYENLRPAQNPLADDARDRLLQLRPLFERYGRLYGIPWVALAAQAFRESRFDQSVISPAGAVGVMQVRPATAAEMGIDDPTDLEANIHAGAAYLAHIRSTWFGDPAIAPQEQLELAWAAYNAGPARIQRIRREAAAEGLDPNRWSGHVELVAARQIGPEPVDYVRDIVKYYVAFRLALEGAASRRASLQAMADSPP